MPAAGALVLTLGLVGDCLCVLMPDGRVAHISVAKIHSDGKRAGIAIRAPKDCKVYRTAVRVPAETLLERDAPKAPPRAIPNPEDMTER